MILPSTSWAKVVFADHLSDSHMNDKTGHQSSNLRGESVVSQFILKIISETDPGSSASPSALKHQIPVASRRLPSTSPRQIAQFLARIQSVVKSGFADALKDPVTVVYIKKLVLA